MYRKNNFITMLGTGNALATRCYNTCFTLHSSGGTVLMVDDVFVPDDLERIMLYIPI